MDLASRATFRGQVTKIVNSAGDFLKSNECRVKDGMDPYALDCIEEELSVFLDRLTAAHASLRKGNADVLSLIKTDDFDREAESVAEYDDKAVSTITRLQIRLNKVKQYQKQLLSPSVPIIDGAPNNDNNISSHNATISLQNKMPAVKLQRLQPKKFSGDYKEWIPFWEQYRTLVHDNLSLSTVDKFNYLEVALTGKAANTLVGLTPSELNYETAINILKEEYGNKEKIIDHNMQCLLSIQPVQSRVDATGLRRLYNSVIASTRSLAALGIPSSNYYVMLKSVLLRCIPNELRVDFHRYYDDSSDNNCLEGDQNDITDHNDNEVSSIKSDISSTKDIGDKTVKYLLKFIKREAEYLEKAQEAKQSSTRVQSSTSKPVKTAVGLFTAGINDNHCFFCKASDHYSSDCKSSFPLVKKKQMLKEDGRCYRCCRKGHYSKMCKKRFQLVCKFCNGRHATSMCDPNHTQSTSTGKKSTAPSPSSQNNTLTSPIQPQQSTNLYTTQTQSHNLVQQVNTVYLQTAFAFASKKNSCKSLYVRMVLDGGSQMSFIKSSVARQLDLDIIGIQNINIIPFGSKEPRPSMQCNKVQVVLRNQYDNRIVSLELMEVPEICVDVLSTPDENLETFSDLQLADVRLENLHAENGISILIGADNYWVVATGQHKRITPDLTAINTVLGWTLQGRSPVISHNSDAVLNLSCVTSLHVCACEDLQHFWRLETIGITNDKIIERPLEPIIRKVADRYEASLPWRDVEESLHDNRIGALYRMHSLVRKLRALGRLRDYESSMQEMINGGLAERVMDDERGDRVYYMPHRPVYREDKDTTKLRIVFDASAHAANHTSLNDHLEVGNSRLPEILTVLLNFRCGKIGLTADIEKAFLQIALAAPDRESHRFFWFKELSNPSGTRTDFSVQAYRMTRVTFGVTSSPNILGEVISKILDDGKERYPRAVDLLRRCFYVDDFVASVNDEEIARDISHEAVKIMKAGSMHLRKWNSNSLLVRNSHPSEIPPPEMQKVLGLRWFVVADELSVDLNAVEVLLKSNSLNGTKRNVLKVMSKIYDPFGLLGPWVVRLKILFQSIWRQNLDWDERLPSELDKIWTESYADVSELSQLMIPRCVLNEEGSTQIHIFADASQHAFGAVAFLRIADNDGNITPRFLCAKNRIAPIKNKDRDELTVPKLELTAALVAARLLGYLRTNLQIKFDEEFLWTDSRIALFWILGKEKRWKPYVENRVREIRTLTKISCWRHCPGSQNPADLLTRGINALSLIQSSEWLSGPDWLRKEATFWPTVNEYKPNTPQALSLFVAGEEEKEESTKINNSVIPCKKFSSWKRLLRTTAYCFRAIDCFKKKQRHDEYASYEDVPFLTASEMDRAENYWVSEAQRLHFNSEIESLTQNKGIPLNSKLLMFSPVLDQNSGHLRVGGRLHFVSSEIQAHPVILPKSSHISKLIVNDVHKKLFHAGVSSVLTHLRSSYWIIKGRQLVKSEVKSCTICKVLRAMPATQPFAPLPRDRITFSSPFDVTGLDFAGPLYTYDSGQKSKAYIMLFTCASIRAVHLELTSDLTTESCLLGIRRFIARRGVPRVIWSDNAATFKKSSKEFFKVSFTNEKFTGFLTNHRISWRFIVERAPWWGGFWERLVGVVKSALKAAIGKATLNTNQLYTFLTEVENVVNNRPLTYVADEPLDLSPLTPSQLLRGPQASQLNECLSTEYDRSQGPEVLRKRWKERLQFIASFKRRWYKEYIQQLMSFHKSKYHRSTDLEIGDVVLMEDRSLPKTLWHLGIIVNIFPGRDGKVRACEVRISDGRTFRRPIQLLYPLEITYRRKDGGPEDVEN